MNKALLLFALSLVAFPASAFFQSTVQPNPLVGTWTLTAADKILPNGQQVRDYGADPQGLAIFTADGRYILEIFRSDRARFASGDRTKGTPDEYRDAVLGNSCHFGHYTIDPAKNTISFHIEHASYPNWDNTTRTSPFKLQGDRLTWTLPPRPDGSIPVSIFKHVQ